MGTNWNFEITPLNSLSEFRWYLIGVHDPYVNTNFIMKNNLGLMTELIIKKYLRYIIYSFNGCLNDVQRNAENTLTLKLKLLLSITKLYYYCLLEKEINKDLSNS